MADVASVVLMVCTGNVCRSPLAAGLLTGKPGLEVVSAGTRALAGHPMDGDAAAELERLGGTADGFAARQLTRAMVEQADVVLTATRAHRAAALELAPRALRRSFTMLELSEILDDPAALDARGSTLADVVADAARRRGSCRLRGEELDVPDPFRRGADAHRRAADLVDGAVTVLRERLAATTA